MRPVIAALLVAVAASLAVGASPSSAVAASLAAPPAVVPVAAPAAAPIVAATPMAASPAAVPAVSVDLDRPTVSTSIGGRFSFASTVRNDGDKPTSGLIAHLNVLSTDPAVYVDPEDWSTNRTQFLDALPARSATRLTWDVQAVNVGRFAVYVTVTTQHGADEVTASNALRVAVAAQRTLNPNGIVPLATAIPATVLVLMGFTVRRRRRLR